MKSLDAQSHYEVLDVGRGARADEIERAYQMANSTWQNGSLALYSLFDDRAAAVVRERIHRAYRILSDAGARRSYDRQLFDSAPESGAGAATADTDPGLQQGDGDFAPMEALDANLADAPEADEELFDGAQLRRTRMQRGIEIDDIAEVTKVSRSYLKSIEEDNFESLPAAVYVRGFLTAYARAIGLDPARVCASYMPRLEAASCRKGRGRLLGRS